ncbi:Hypothetical Protein U712_02705 [Bacillus subtilis PY79]|nr:Hypothetical Protein U712_02705 [Bacillus subtilis PY79]AKE22359.1 hypothetical protein BsLM_0560 [Bacillus sp. LM 4-2]EME08576.1 hypothetical protein BS732_1462 [Bacillus subtilis MB73/2]KZD82847.1 hypothetical protein B4417_1590 [Bacillus subtilis]
MNVPFRDGESDFDITDFIYNIIQLLLDVKSKMKRKKTIETDY